MAPIIISIEGNIGSGKSTIVKYLRSYYESKEFSPYVFLDEPVDEWNSIVDNNGVNMIQKFYGNPEKYAFAFQMMAYISRLQNLRSAIALYPNKIIITERSLFTDKFVFAKMLYDEGKIDTMEYQIYEKWFDAFIDDIHVTKVVYVNTQPEVCESRIKVRDRNGEENITREYLDKCHTYHEAMIDSLERSTTTINVVNGNHDIYQDEFVVTKWIESIEQ